MKLLPIVEPEHILNLSFIFYDNHKALISDVEVLVTKTSTAEISPAYRSFEMNLLSHGYSVKYVKTVLLRLVTATIAVNHIEDTVARPPNSGKLWLEEDDQELMEIAATAVMPAGMGEIAAGARMMSVTEEIFNRMSHRLPKTA